MFAKCAFLRDLQRIDLRFSLPFADVNAPLYALEFANFRFDYILQKANLVRVSKKSNIQNRFTNYKDFSPVRNPPLSENGRQ